MNLESNQVIEIEVDTTFLIKNSAKFKLALQYIQHWSLAIVVSNLINSLLLKIVNLTDTYNISYIALFIGLTVINIAGYIRDRKELNMGMNLIHVNSKEKIIIDLEKRILQLKYKISNGLDIDNEYCANFYNIGNIEYYTLDRLLKVNTNKGDAISKSIEAKYRAKYILDNEAIFNIEISPEKLKTLDGVIQIKEKEHLSLEKDIVMKEQRMCDIIDTGECIYGNKYKGKCEFCRLSEGCELKKKNVRCNCGYWRCFFRESTDSCRIR